MKRIEIRYRRPPDRLDVFFQDLVLDGPDCKITLHDPSTLTATLSVDDHVIYEPGAPIVWFVFPDAWYDIGRFHLRDGTFTGYYVNLILPPDLTERSWSMYDLCLDIWIDPQGGYQVLDQDEFDEAVDNRWIDPATASRARKELRRIIDELVAGRFPPPPVGEHDLQRARALRAQSHETRRTPLR